MTKRLTITEQGRLREYLSKHGPTAGMIQAFQFGAEAWLAIAGCPFSEPSRFKQLTEIIGARFSECERITIFNACFEIAGSVAISVEILGYGLGEKKNNPTQKMRVCFWDETGTIVNWH